MKIAIPLNGALTLYHLNPCTAPKFAIYTIEGDKSHLTFSLLKVVDNPWCIADYDGFDPEQVACRCQPERRRDIRHISEHYTLLDAIGGCSYLLADHFCDNTSRALGNGGVKVFKIPPVIRETDNAIKNFLIGAELADTVKHIHHAS